MADDAQGDSRHGPAGLDFRARARAEADRYGPDPWVFVRELLQNARDAGATAVAFTARSEGGRWRLHCRDDGEGMSYEHARRYLFALYASSKEQRRDQVGRFGVGFWSILRFEPARITIRSRPRVSGETGRSGQGPTDSWELEITGDLESAVQRVPDMGGPGTEVVLERPAPDGELERRVFEAAWQNARFLCTRDQPDRPLLVTVNGKPINAKFELPAPSAAFRRGSVRGVVGLGNAARVELFSRGLRVRAAASLADFTAGGGRHTGRSRVQFTELPGRLAPQALLESEALELLLSRSDARENRALLKLVRLAERELGRLITRQLDAVRPLAWWRRLGLFLRRRLRDSLAFRTAIAAGFGALTALAVAWTLWGDHVFARLRADLAFLTGGEGGLVVGTPSEPSPRYTDLGRLYRGPQVDVLSGSGVPIELTYAPAEEDHYFAALILDDLEHAGDAAAIAPTSRGPYIGTACRGENIKCTAVQLVVESAPGLLRLPAPTGHRVDAASVRLDDVPQALVATQHDEPALVLPTATRAVLRYVTVPAIPLRRTPTPARGARLPADLRAAAAALRTRSQSDRVAPLVELTRQRVRYSNDPDVALAHQDPALADLHFLDRTLKIGAGDCDLQNALLVALLREAGVPARMAIGFVGQRGRANSWLHAWAEFRVGDGPWEIADASASDRPRAFTPGTVPVPAVSTPAEAPSSDSGEPATAPSESGPTQSGPTKSGPGEPTSPGESVDPGAAAVAPAAAPAPSEAPEALPPARTPAAPWLRQWLARGSLALLALAGLGLVMLLLRRTRREVALEAGHDLSRLLQGALQQPEAFRSVPDVFQRPLVPTAGGRALSLDAARALAGKGHLYRTRTGCDLARRAVAGGAHVLEDSVAEARAVADALGAVDLDPWDTLLADTAAGPLLDAVNAALRAAGERLVVVAGPGFAEEVRSLDLAPLRLRGSPWRGRRVVAVSADNPWMRDASAALATRPRAAVFAALDYLADRLDLPADRRAGLLHAAARAAVHEAAV
ncbi:MAG: ATP-binding protein [Myxococcales bacterium]|nr:ATP-binding protein [Myxococcales bacterium]